MRWIDSCNHNIFSICLSCLREHNFFLNEKEWLIPQKKEVFFLFYEVQVEIFISLLRNRPWINSLFIWEY